MEQSYVAENAAETQRLKTLVAGLSDADLGHPLEEDRTVAILLAHLAFWDRYALALLEKWERAGFQPVSIDAGVVNTAMQTLVSALAPRAAAQLAVDAAEAIDQKLEQISPDRATQIEAGGHGRILRRALHRRDHLNQLTQVLGLEG